MPKFLETNKTQKVTEANRQCARGFNKKIKTNIENLITIIFLSDNMKIICILYE